MKELSRSRRILLVALVLICVGAVFGWRLFLSEPSIDRHVESAPAKTQPSPPTAASPAVVALTSAVQSRPAQTANANGGGASAAIARDRPRFIADVSPAQRKAGDVDVDLRKAATSVRDYRKAFNENPAGDNAEITKRLLGKNSRSLRCLPDDVRTNTKGELTDRWDQPIFFHQISGTNMEIRSAGPDRIMWTADDEVLR